MKLFPESLNHEGDPEPDAPPKTLADVTAYEVWLDHNGDAVWRDESSEVLVCFTNGRIARYSRSPATHFITRRLGPLLGIVIDDTQ